MPLDNEIGIQSYRKVCVRNFWNVLDIHSYWHSDRLDGRQLELQKDILHVNWCNN